MTQSSMTPFSSNWKYMNLMGRLLNGWGNGCEIVPREWWLMAQRSDGDQRQAVPQGAEQAPGLLNAFINHINSWIKCTLRKLLDYAKLCGMVNTPKEGLAIQRDLDKLSSRPRWFTWGLQIQMQSPAPRLWQSLLSVQAEGHNDGAEPCQYQWYW